MIIANMQTPPWKLWMPRIATFVVALLLAASVLFWVLRWPVQEPGPALPLAAAGDELAPAATGSLVSSIAGLLGAQGSPVVTAVAPDASSRFVLTGVVALGAGRGVALVSIDGKPAKPYRMGSPLEDGWVLQSVGQRSIALGADARGPVRLKLELAPRRP